MTVGVSVEDATGRAAQVLTMAEAEPDLSRMERLERLADCWLALATLLVEREQA